MSKVTWESEKGRLLQVCHPMHFEGSRERCERDSEDHDGFFEPWSHEKLEASSTNGLEITVAFLAVKNSNIPGKRIFELPDKLLRSWGLTEEDILGWANSWWNQGNKETTNYIPKFVLYPRPKPADQIPADEVNAIITDIKQNCKLVVELTEEAGSVTGRFGYSVFDEENAQLTLNLKDSKEEYRKHTVVHEFGHVLGLKHEHQRSDFWRGIYRFTDFHAIGQGGEQFPERKETKGVYDDYTTYDSLSVMNYYWRLEYFKKRYRQWFEPQSTRKVEIAKKRLNLEISATEEMVLMSMCDQLHKVKTLKYFIESKGVYNNEWVLGTQLEPRDAPLPKKPEDIPEKGVKAWIKLISGRPVPVQKPVTIRKVEHVAGSTDNGSKHINDDGYKFVVKPSTKDIKLVNWAYNTDKPMRPYSLPQPPPPVVKPVQPTASGKAQFKVHLEPFDRSYGDLGQLKVIVVAGNPVKYKLAPTETQVTLPKTTGQGKVNARIFVAHTEDASKLVEKDVVIDDTATPSVELAKDDCYYAFIRLYARDGNVFRDSNAVPLFELKSVEKARLCYDNLKARAKSEVEVAIFAPKAILSESLERVRLKKEFLKLLEEDINLPENCMEKYQFGPLNESFVQQLVRVMEFLLHFRGRNDLPFLLIEKIGVMSSELKRDIALYKVACEVENLKAVEVAYKEPHSIEISSDGPAHCWRLCSDEGFRKMIPAGYSRLRVLIKINENQYLFERLVKLGRTLSSGKQFYTHEMYTSKHETSHLHVVFLMPLAADKDPKRAFRDKVQPKIISALGIMEVVHISHENKETVIYPDRIQTDATKRYRKRARKVSIDSEHEGMLSLLSSIKKHSVRKTGVTTSRVEADSGMDSSMELVLKYAPNWKVVAKDLGFSDKRVECIESDYQQPERCLHVIIWKWLHNKKGKSDDEKPTIDNLKTVMEKVSLA